MQTLISQMQNICNTWWKQVLFPAWPNTLPNVLGQALRPGEESLGRLNEWFETAFWIPQRFFAAICSDPQPGRESTAGSAGTNVEDSPEPVSRDCQLPGG